MATWVIGDIHGCAEELDELIGLLSLNSDDRLVSVGDLFHRGPDPTGVMDVFQAAGGSFILGNHELRVLQRFGLDPKRADAADRPALREEFPQLEEEDLAGDGKRRCSIPPERRVDFLRFLQSHSGFYLEHAQIPGAGPTRDGRPWCVVHAGIVPGQAPRDSQPEELVSLRRLPLRGGPYWYEVYTGSNLILFGHTPAKTVRARHAGGRLTSLGVDTGCVYGGELTAYCPESEDIVRVSAKQKYAHK